MTEKFNVSGEGGRDCPVCLREASLFGARDGDRPRLTCNGCAAQFVLIWSDGVLPDTLERQPVEAPVNTFELRSPAFSPRARRS